MIKKIVFVLCILYVSVLNAQEGAKIYESKIGDNTKTFLKIIEKGNEEYYSYPNENYNNFRAEAPVFNLFNVVDTLDFIKNGVFDDLVLNKGIYVFSIRDRKAMTFLFVSDDFYTYSTGYNGRPGELRYHYFNLEELLENFIQNNPDFIKNEVEKQKIIYRLQHENYTRITSLR